MDRHSQQQSSRGPSPRGSGHSLGQQQSQTSQHSLGPRRSPSSQHSLGQQQSQTSQHSLGQQQSQTSQHSLGPRRSQTSQHSNTTAVPHGHHKSALGPRARQNRLLQHIKNAYDEMPQNVDSEALLLQITNPQQQQPQFEYQTLDRDFYSHPPPGYPPQHQPQAPGYPQQHQPQAASQGPAQNQLMHLIAHRAALAAPRPAATQDAQRKRIKGIELQPNITPVITLRNGLKVRVLNIAPSAEGLHTVVRDDDLDSMPFQVDLRTASKEGEKLKSQNFLFLGEQ